ncbi:MAG: dephospho-CoA kinase [Rickettsiaceae bacterium]|nr:MAG: dephospho-CoA kinase [Rickettsiaceae bacterium]
MIIAITGCIASGKSTVLNYLKNNNYLTFSADEFVDNLYQNLTIRHKILRLIPKLKIFNKHNIANIIYNDKTAKDKLEQLIYPYIINEIIKIKTCTSKYEITFAEMPLLFEAQLENYFEYVIVTIAPRKRRFERASLRSSINYEIFNKIEQIQYKQKEKIAGANFIINTDVKMLKLELQIINILEKLKCQQ